METRRLLAISWAMPPILAPRSIQVSRTIQALADLGWNIDLLCVSPESASKAYKLDASLPLPAASKVNMVRICSSEQSRIQNILRRIFSPLRFIPDASRAWIKPAIASGMNLLKKNNYDAMISFAQPWSDHIVALQLQETTNLRWIAHFSDPWTDSPYFAAKGIGKLYSKQKEQAVLARADAIIFTNEQTRSTVMQKYPPDWKHKTHVIPHGFDADIVPASLPSLPDAGKLHLVYTGNFYQMRSPEPLMHALAKVCEDRTHAEQLAVTFIGSTPAVFQEMAATLNLSDIIRFLPTMPNKEAIENAAQADILLIIDAPSEKSLFLPSKLIDYLPLRKPILGITPLEGASADLLRRLECRVCPPDDISQIANAIKSLLKKWKQGTLGVSASYDQVARSYDIRETTQILNRILLGERQKHDQA